ncbi:MAG: hypothetical protein R3B07_22055 [Polyangiaceae bacterium]
MKRLAAWLALMLSSFGLDRWLASQLFETNVVASLLAPSAATALTSALLALTFLLNRLALYVALPAGAAAALSLAAFRGWLKPVSAQPEARS